MDFVLGAAAGLAGLAVLPDLTADPFVGVLICVFIYAVGSGLIEVLCSPIVEACPFERKEAVMSLLHSFYCWGSVGVVALSTLFFAVFGMARWRVLALLWALVPLYNCYNFATCPIETLVDEEISIGDYVLTGGELPALVLVDAVVRMLDGTLSQPDCYEDESHYRGLLEYPQYTRPEVWHDMRVPEILLSGHHANIAKWRHEQALIATAKKRPDLLDKIELSAEDLAIIHKVVDFDK